MYNQTSTSCFLWCNFRFLSPEGWLELPGDWQEEFESEWLDTGIGLQDHQIHLFLEAKFPSLQRASSIVKDNVVSVTPYAPACYHNDFSKNSGAKLPPCLQKHGTRFQSAVPLNIQEPPAPLAKGALKEESQ
ncbi:hypothetical protein EJB05_09104 [Eragrostis curvula]|uniref:Uncharacterized protein n=1 Tax=Eragrostis curvula TaxID=38414 RepID=A0A5J9W5B0_9POAL|nr:hypothetical protein EJB05_09104 [Eragrostis curvula]